ncbi:hypothetical protein [Cryobacterium sp. TMB1-7]|uniref:hypothetical protein n=1 Tax=Cryobacterium sp. TMB1-7 TaxID=2555866 RepID=UPI00106DA7D5|nr:hypothetical protein [Cryobacterium sp. TMB1-7]TFC63063.1 hypothetical protein E3O60_00615 [Cryobacterium sp. TMB1-7]
MSADSTSSELRTISRELTDWINENYAQQDTRIHIRLHSGEKSIGLSSVNEANDVRLDLVETAMETGLFAAVSLRAPWQGSELSDDEGYESVNLLVLPRRATTPGSALISADALINAAGFTRSTSTVMMGDLDEYAGASGSTFRSTVRTNSSGPLPEGSEACINALFALTDIYSFNVALPASDFGNDIFVSDEKAPGVQQSLADQGCDQVLAPIGYQPE